MLQFGKSRSSQRSPNSLNCIRPHCDSLGWFIRGDGGQDGIYDAGWFSEKRLRDLSLILSDLSPKETPSWPSALPFDPERRRHDRSPGHRRGEGESQEQSLRWLMWVTTSDLCSGCDKVLDNHEVTVGSQKIFTLVSWTGGHRVREGSRRDWWSAMRSWHEWRTSRRERRIERHAKAIRWSSYGRWPKVTPPPAPRPGRSQLPCPRRHEQGS
jgi:hypothetical protein